MNAIGTRCCEKAGLGREPPREGRAVNGGLGSRKHRLMTAKGHSSSRG